MSEFIGIAILFGMPCVTAAVFLAVYRWSTK